MTIQYKGTVFVCKTEEDVKDVCAHVADLEEQEAQRAAIGRRWLQWAEQDEPRPTANARRVRF